MKRLAVLAFAAGLVSAQSHPHWWTNASPESTALVGIQWANVRNSFLAPRLRAQIGPGGALGFPALPCLNDAEQILISSPDLLAIASGACPAGQLRREAESLGYKASAYRGFALWVTPGTESLSVAVFADRLLFLGKTATLREAIDRSQSRERSYTRLLARAAAYAKEDVWVVAKRLPDPLASAFLPRLGETDLRSLDFEGSVSLWDGLHAVASITGTGIRNAEETAAGLQAYLDARPSLTEGSAVTIEKRDIVVRLDATEEQIAAVVGAAPVEAGPVPAVPASAPAPVAVASPPPPAPPKSVAPEKPKVIRIFGLGDRPREVPLTPAR